MFGFGRKAKLQKAIDRALAPVEHEDDVADHAPLEELAPELQVEAFARVARALHRDDRHPAAKRSLDRGLELAPDALELNELAATVARELGDLDAAIAAQQRVVAASPREPEPVDALAEMLLEADRVTEALEVLRPLRALDEPMIDTRFAEALFFDDQHTEAFAILDRVCQHYDAARKQLGFSGGWRVDSAFRLRDEVYAKLHGREATIDLHASEAKLDARAGVNYRLLGAQLAAKSERIADVVELEDPDSTERRGQVLLAQASNPARGLVLIGSAQLRRGEVSMALETFEQACEADGRCFAAFLGLGAAMEHERYDLHRMVRRLALPSSLPPELAACVPDFSVLTEAERRVVWASVQPLRSALPPLVEAGAKIRILPIDVRATDVGIFEAAVGERADDQRSYDAISGLATHGGAIAKIEELLDIVSDAAWTFAHELAHVAFFHMPEQRTAPFVEIYERALDVGYANTEYALSNIDEFFAVGYADFLRLRHGTPGAPIRDDAGIHDALTRYFDELT
jgi:tetratricopeptide (TPR) repeat protein